MRGRFDGVGAPHARWPARDARVRVALAEAHSGMRSSLRALLDQEPNLCVIAAAADGESALRLLGEHPDVLILDHAIAGNPAGERFRALLAASADAGASIVITTMYDSHELALRALDAGASAVVLKDAAASDLVPAIRQATRGHRYLSPGIR